MKTLTAFSALLIFIITACSTNVEPEPPEFESYRIGDFVMVSPQKAELDYSNNRMNDIMRGLKNDTIRVTSLNNKSFIVAMDTVNKEVNIGYTDSTITGDSVNFRKTKIRVNGVIQHGVLMLRGNQYVTTMFIYPYPCQKNLFPAESELSISLFKNNGLHLRTYIFSVDGLEQVSEIIKKCN